MSQLKQDFYIAGVKHECRFCGTPLAKLKEGILFPLANKAHLTIITENGTLHRFNCCKQCAKKDFKNNPILQEVWESDVDMWKKLEIMEGVDQEDAEKRADILKEQKIVLDFVGVEMELKHANAVMKKAEKRIKKLKKDKK
jgi:hypothetical protein